MRLKEILLAPAVVSGFTVPSGMPGAGRRCLKRSRGMAMSSFEDMSDSDIFADLKKRMADGPLDQGVVSSSKECYDKADMKLQYYKQFWKAKNLRRGGEEGMARKDSRSSNGNSSEAKAEESRGELNEFSALPSPELSGWSTEDLSQAYSRYVFLSESLRGYDHVPYEKAGARTQAMDSLFSPSEDFWSRAELKHGRGATLAFLLSNSFMFLQNLEEHLAPHTITNVFSHHNLLDSTTLFPLTALGILCAAGLEKAYTRFNSNAENSEKSWAQSVSDFISATAKQCMPGYTAPDGSRVVFLARQTEVGHGRLAMVALASSVLVNFPV